MGGVSAWRSRGGAAARCGEDASTMAVTGAWARANDALQPFSIPEAALASPPRIARAARRTGGTLEQCEPATPGREDPGRNAGGGS
jgi:hypothetical protein